MCVNEENLYRRLYLKIQAITLLKLKASSLIVNVSHSFLQNMLPDGLALEAEKVLCTLVCFSNDRRIKMKFIEACVDNVAHHK